MNSIRIGVVAFVFCVSCMSIAFAGPMADIMVPSNVFTIGDVIDVSVMAVNPTHEFEVDVYLSGKVGDTTWYLEPSGWTLNVAPLLSNFMVPQFTEPLLLRLGQLQAGVAPALPGEKCTLTLQVTASNVPEMVYCQDCASFSVAPDGFVAIPSCRFVMGTDHPRPGHEAEVQHKVCLHSFFIAETEPTYREFCDFLNDVGALYYDDPVLGHVAHSPDGKEFWAAMKASIAMHLEWADGVFYPSPGFEEHPAVMRNLGCEAYSAWKGAKLPTEAQWEYAARAYSTGDFPWGDEESCDDLNARVDGHCCIAETVPVASYPPNAFGLYDVSGNVMEMCRDWNDYGGGPYPGGLYFEQSYYQWCLANYPHGIIDPQGPDSLPPDTEFPKKVARGGLWDEPWPNTTWWYRNWADNSSFGNSCRPVIEIPIDPQSP